MPHKVIVRPLVYRHRHVVTIRAGARLTVANELRPDDHFERDVAG